MKEHCQRGHDHSTLEYPVYASVDNPNAKVFHCPDLQNECGHMRAFRHRANPQKFPWVPMGLQEMQQYREDRKRPLLRPCDWCFPN